MRVQRCGLFVAYVVASMSLLTSCMEISMRSKNWKSLDLYGKVIDQYGEPVVNAKVEGSILLNVSFVESGGETHFTQTDSQGCFDFLGIHGVKIGILPQKEGYFYNQRLPSQRPGDYRPDPNNQVGFTMWKIHGAEPLINSAINAKIAPDGNTETFDMVTGTQSPLPCRLRFRPIAMIPRRQPA